MSKPPPNIPAPEAAAEAASREDVELSLQITRRLFKTLAAINVGKVPFDQAVALLKQAYVQAAIRQLEREQPDKRLTRSAIALLTGMDGRTVAHLLDAPEDAEDEGHKIQQSPHAQILGSWASHDRWRDPETGQPRPLTIYGAGDTFQALVKSTIGKSISYSMVLETLISHGNVRRVGDNQVELVQRLFRSQGSDAALKRQSNRMIYGLGKNIIHYLENGDDDEWWPRGIIWNQRVPPEKLAELRVLLRDLLVDKHTPEIGETIDTCADQEDRPGQATAGLGWYYWEDV